MGSVIDVMADGHVAPALACVFQGNGAGGGAVGAERRLPGHGRAQHDLPGESAREESSSTWHADQRLLWRAARLMGVVIYGL